MIERRPTSFASIICPGLLSMRTAFLCAIFLATSIVAAGCVEPHLQAELTGSLTYGSCGEVLPWSPRFASWAETGATDAVMRFQTLSNNSSVQNDSLLFVINDARALLDDPSTPIDVGDREHEGARASANFVLWVACPEEPTLSVYLHGTLQFDELSHERDGVIRGRFTGEARDQRTQDVIGTNLLFSFDFERSRHAPWQPYTNKK